MLSSDFLNGLYIIPLLAVLILVHEAGHYFAARRCGVKVEEFGIGIPPRLFGWTRNGVIWSINAIPFGGFVRVKGEDGANVDSDSMNAKPPLQRAFFLAAGAGMNVLFAVLLMFVVLGVKGNLHQSTYVSGVGADSPAAKAGWQAGDRIVEMNGEEVETTEEIVGQTRDNAGEELTVSIERRGSIIDTRLIPRENPPEGQGRVGVSLDQEYQGIVRVEELLPGSPGDAAGLQVGDEFVSVNDRAITDFFVLQTELVRFQGSSVPMVVRRDGVNLATELAVPPVSAGTDVFAEIGLPTLRQTPDFEQVPLAEIIPRGFQESYEATTLMLGQLKSLVTEPEQLRNVAGPIGMGQITSRLVTESALPTWYILANIGIILSLNLAVLNLLPLPALDGGRLLFVLIEIVRGGRKIAPEKEGLVHFAGLVLLIGLMFVIAFRDIGRIVGAMPIPS